MSIQTVAEKFVELCNQGKNFEVMRTMYAPEMVSVEGDGRETVGRQPVIRKSEVFGENNTIHSQGLRGPFFCGDHAADAGRFGVYHTIDVTRKSSGERVTLEEVALYTVKDGQITREEFFYDGMF
jgi:hypothetical protein